MSIFPLDYAVLDHFDDVAQSSVECREMWVADHRSDRVVRRQVAQQAGEGATV